MDVDTRAMANRDMAGRFIIVVADIWLGLCAIICELIMAHAWHWHKKNKKAAAARIFGPVSGPGPISPCSPCPEKKVAAPSAGREVGTRKSSESGKLLCLYILGRGSLSHDLLRALRVRCTYMYP